MFSGEVVAFTFFIPTKIKYGLLRPLQTAVYNQVLSFSKDYTTDKVEKKKCADLHFSSFSTFLDTHTAPLSNFKKSTREQLLTTQQPVRKNNH